MQHQRPGEQSLRNCRGFDDKRCSKPRSILERRERSAAAAFVRGQRWYAKKNLGFQKFTDWRSACKALLQSSHRLIEESRLTIVKTTNVLAFSRKTGKLV